MLIEYHESLFCVLALKVLSLSLSSISAVINSGPITEICCSYNNINR